MTDEALLARARGGDEAAFAQLYERYRGPLYGFAYRLTNSVPEAEDLVHDSIIGMMRPESRFDPARGALRPYLYAAVRNLALKRYRDARFEELDEDAAVEPEPLAAMLSAETARRVQSAIAELSDLQREALVLFEYEEMPLEEIARIVQADVGTVKSRLHRARQRLRRVLRMVQKV